MISLAMTQRVTRRLEANYLLRLGLILGCNILRSTGRGDQTGRRGVDKRFSLAGMRGRQDNEAP
jgi:hypothetical protein